MNNKKCSRCGKVKSTTGFPKDKSRPDGLFCYCKECNSAHSRKWVIENREKAAEYLRSYRIEHIEKARQYGRDYSKARFRANKELYRGYVIQRRINKRANTVNPPSMRQITTRMKLCGEACVYCGGAFEQIEHVIAISKGGSDDIHNLVPACGNCNASKASQDWIKWFRKHRCYSQEREMWIVSLITPKND